MGRDLMKRGLIAAAVAGLALVGASPAWAVFPGENGRIAYAAGLGRAYRAHTILPSGHGDMTIGGWGPGKWSPNGRWMVFMASDYNIYTMRADGTDRRQLTFDAQSYFPSYSPGGGRIVFNSPAGITIMKTDGSHRQVIAAQGAVAYTWAPNGEIAFYEPATDSRPASLWAMNPNGTNPHRLLRRAGSGPLYAPDGGRFLFIRDDTALLADADGGDVRKAPCQAFFARFEPQTYSPDGRWFLGADLIATDPREGYPYALARVNLTSCEWKKVVSPAWNGADWQPIPTP
jgi:Tol biopolymer transport system component